MPGRRNTLCSRSKSALLDSDPGKKLAEYISPLCQRYWLRLDRPGILHRAPTPGFSVQLALKPNLEPKGFVAGEGSEQFKSILDFLFGRSTP